MASATSFRQIIGVPPSTASPTDSTLIIIDAQNEYAEGKLTVRDVASSRKAIAALLQKYRDANQGGNIVHVVHDTPQGAPIFTPGTKLAEEFAELTPKEGEKVVRKQHPGAFAGTDLQAHLEGLGDRGKKIVLTGYMAHICVSTTSRQASQLGFELLVAEDAVGDRDIPGVDAAQLVKVVLSEIADGFGTIVQSKDIV
ncbi:isochorismatase [Colletotrichum orchidophilum]|uniref:Isochorismatase n=1 Tax=Colletotrichum orchidophilum TaxID=1209926 RepID=A0A1G4B8E6_9PEZI|nr:isochorismatase [Colletotrichum orchidophilum]OHE97709.1 isochorismatase [Colletotrichum orchidophilum]